MNFADLGLRPEILRAVEDVGYTSPTPIQEQAIPYVLQGRDVLGIAQTGTGKTAGFTLPMIDILASGRARARMPRSLILEPTRELATQVAENFELYGKYEKLNFALLIGGSGFDEQVRKLDRGADVLIATPGRMLDLFERGKVLLADVRILVIDEADRMLDMGFIPDIERIIGLLPKTRQTLFFSATMPPEIRRLADAFLTAPKQVSVAPPATTAERVEQHVVVVRPDDKREALRRLLRRENVRNALVFCNRKRDVTIVYRSLTKHGFNAGQLHGDMAQSQRTETLEGFKRGEVQILVCSDVAARGLDISELSHVFNFDVPPNAEDYVHRIGRTARAGRSGRTFTLATPQDSRYVAAIGKLIKQDIPVVTIDGLELAPEELRPDEGKRKRKRRPKEAAPQPAAARPAGRPEPAPPPEKGAPPSRRRGRSRHRCRRRGRASTAGSRRTRRGRCRRRAPSPTRSGRRRAARRRSRSGAS